MGEPSKRLKLVEDGPHHFLIVSGLYGLVNAEECIQRYSFSLSDHKDIVRLWKKKGALTRVLLAYVKEFQITRIFDLTGLQGYRSLFHWQSLQLEVEDGVLHAFSERNAGDPTLPALGWLAGYLLQQEEELLIKHKEGDLLEVPGGEVIVLTASETPPEGFPQEPWEEPAPAPPKRPERPSPSKGIEEPPRTDLPVQSGQHGTIFGNRVHGMGDLPRGARELFENASRSAYIRGVYFGRFWGGGKRTKDFELRLSQPTPGSGRIEGNLHGPGRLGGVQEVEIRVDPGRETQTYQLLLRLGPRIKAR